jgi:TatD DNase family protein
MINNKDIISLIDSHCHLNMKDLADRQDEVISRASEFGVNYMQTICTKLSEFPEVLAIAKKYDNIFASVGIHPHEVDKEGIAEIQTLLELANDPKVIAFGETGLDYYYEYSNRDNQKISFINHIKSARMADKPVIVHSRDADDDTIEILEKETKDNGPFKGIIHCFSTGRELAERSVALGLYISISGIITFKNAENLREIVRDLPIDKLLVETDAPFLSPIPMRGKINEPAYTYYVAEKIAEIKNISLEEVAKTTSDNFFRLMNINTYGSRILG